jgi:hypothetical protein
MSALVLTVMWLSMPRNSDMQSTSLPILECESAQGELEFPLEASP